MLVQRPEEPSRFNSNTRNTTVLGKEKAHPERV